jgi:hypothetical protein
LKDEVQENGNIELNSYSKTALKGHPKWSYKMDIENIYR